VPPNVRVKRAPTAWRQARGQMITTLPRGPGAALLGLRLNEGLGITEQLRQHVLASDVWLVRNILLSFL
jgi:hypothetical protein